MRLLTSVVLLLLLCTSHLVVSINDQRTTYQASGASKAPGGGAPNGGGAATSFPVLSRLASLPRKELLRNYLPSINQNATTLDDEACPAFLITGDLIVCGNLFVRNRLQVITAANLTVFEEALFDTGDTDAATDRSQSSVIIKTHTVGKFLAERCSRSYTYYDPDEGDPPRCSVMGNLVVSKSGLIVSGSLTVLGSVMAGSLQLDEAASAAFGVGAFLNIHNSTATPEVASQGGQESPKRSTSRAPRRGARRVNHDEVSQTTRLEIWPPRGTLDMVCLERKHIPDALFIAKGITYMRNAANFFTFGRAILHVAGLDRAAHWLSRCGGLLLVTPDGEPGHIGILSASHLRVTGPDIVDTGSLLVADGATLTIEEGLQVREVGKVFQSSTLEVQGEAAFFDLIMSRSSTAAIGTLFVKDLMILTQAQLLVSRLLHVNSMEAYDASIIEARSELQAEDYVVLDDGSALSVVTGDATIGGALMAANFSSFSVLSPSGLLTVGEDMRLRTGVVLEAPRVIVGCSILLDVYAKLLVNDQVQVRHKNLLIGPERKSPPCDDASPLLYARQSSITAGAWMLGGRELNKTSEVDRAGGETPIVTILDKASLTVKGSFQSATREHALLLKNAASMQVIDGPIFDPGKLVMLESTASLVLTSVSKAIAVGIDLAENAELLIKGLTDMSLQWIKVLSKSRFMTDPLTTINIERLLEVELESEALIKGGFTINSDQIDHVLCTTRSSLYIPPADIPFVLAGNWIAQDGGIIQIDRDVEILTNNTTLISETFSHIILTEHIVSNNASGQIHLQRTPESEISLLNQGNCSILETIYRLKVPPSDSASLTKFVKEVKQPVKKNAFWDSWAQSNSAPETEETVTNAAKSSTPASGPLWDEPMSGPAPPSPSTSPAEPLGRRRSNRRVQRSPLLI